MKPYEAPDFLEMDSYFSDEEKMIRDTVRQYVSKEIMPIIADANDKGEFPKQLIPGLAELGTLGATIQGYGCAGLNYTSYGLAYRKDNAPIQSQLQIFYPTRSRVSKSKKKTSRRNR